MGPEKPGVGVGSHASSLASSSASSDLVESMVTDLENTRC